MPHDSLALYGKLRPYLDKAAIADWPGMSSTDILVIEPGACIDSVFLGFLAHSEGFTRHAIATTAGVNPFPFNVTALVPVASTVSHSPNRQRKGLQSPRYRQNPSRYPSFDTRSRSARRWIGDSTERRSVLSPMRVHSRIGKVVISDSVNVGDNTPVQGNLDCSD
jgi:hypothetical protein